MEYFSPKIENPKGAAAEGRRPLLGVAEGHPSILGENYSQNTPKILRGVFLEYFLTIMYSRGSPREYFLSIWDGPSKIPQIVLLEYFQGFPIFTQCIDMCKV